MPIDQNILAPVARKNNFNTIVCLCRRRLSALLIGGLTAVVAAGSPGLRAATFNAAARGALGDDHAVNTVAIQATIDAAAAAGAERWFFPKAFF